MIPNVLSIAGFDPSGGAGVLADAKTISACGCYAAAVVTALTAQNTKRVFEVRATPADFVAKQIDVVFSDVRIDAVKIGMLVSASIAEAVADRLAHWRPRVVVLDPVLAASSGDALSASDSIGAIRSHLVPLTHLITPNLPEAAAFLEFARPILELELEVVAAKFLEWGAGAVLLKGGHASGPEAVDQLFAAGMRRAFSAPRVATNSTHGTGCALAAAIACGLARGDDLAQAVMEAKLYVSGALRSATRLSVGEGHGPIDHFWRRSSA